MSPIDVVLLTLNSERLLDKCIKSIYKNVPVGKLIVVDGGSKDATLKILFKLKQRFSSIHIIHDKGTRATARQKGIKKVTSEWFLFVDSDVILCAKWFDKAVRKMGKDVGAIWGMEIWSTLNNQSTLKMFLLITRKIFELRGGTHDTLIRKKAIEDIQIPANLHVFEDAYIKDWIVRKGYRVVACYNPFCIHYRSKTVWTLNGALKLIADAVRYCSVKLLIKLIFAYGFYTAYSIFQLLSKTNKEKPHL